MLERVWKQMADGPARPREEAAAHVRLMHSIRRAVEAHQPEGWPQWYVDANVIDCDAEEFWKVVLDAIGGYVPDRQTVDLTDCKCGYVRNSDGELMRLSIFGCGFDHTEIDGLIARDARRAPSPQDTASRRTDSKAQPPSQAD